ncbi:MAG: hypothetical protein WA140_09170 [Geobacteraceae bacterium]
MIAARMRAKLLRRLRLKDAWVIFFILGIVMMNYPFIKMFSDAPSFFDIPALYLYLEIGWLISICVIYLFVKALDLTDEQWHEGERR